VLSKIGSRLNCVDLKVLCFLQISTVEIMSPFFYHWIIDLVNLSHPIQLV
jgi:hypothetical protein